MAGLSVRQISFAYGRKTVLDNVSFDIEPGQFCALLGPNGAGKSTLFSLLTRLFVADQGTIEIAGHNVAQKPRKALQNIGVVFQQPTLDLDLTVWRNLTYFAGLHGLSGVEVDKAIRSAVDQLDMADRTAERVRDLNGGHRRRLEIARALIHDPPVLLLDEPTVGLDLATRKMITDHVHDLARLRGKTVLWATHLTDEIQDQDQIVLLHQGQVLCDQSCLDLRGERSLRDAFLDETGATL